MMSPICNLANRFVCISLQDCINVFGTLLHFTAYYALTVKSKDVCSLSYFFVFWQRRSQTGRT